VTTRTRLSVLLTAASVIGASAVVGLAGASAATAAPARSDASVAPLTAPLRAPAYYEVLARHSRKCLDVRGASTANSAPVIQYTCHLGHNQEWRLVHISGNYYELIARHSGKCLDVRGASRANSAPVIQYTCHRGANQQWGFIAVR
jgi:Ricin-type beta-trefoil lectin domain.